MVLLFGSAAVLLPLHVQELEFPRFFTGADAHLSLQSLEDLKKQVDAGRCPRPRIRNGLLTLLDRFNSSRATRLSLVTSVAVFVTMLDPAGHRPVVGPDPCGMGDEAHRAPRTVDRRRARSRGAALIALFPLQCRTSRCWSSSVLGTDGCERRSGSAQRHRRRPDSRG
ncbi:hypothetical protein [Streptomyces echinatus]|uniref:hypothetical protein n=1 Tax=Streptomyces echinatus TaxID=67293 RepID=UPI0031F0A26A